MLDFGDYCTIEQKRYSGKNEQYKYKVIGAGEANYYRSVPVDGCDQDNKIGDMCEVVKAIKCGVCEEIVETFRLQDVQA